MLIIHIFNKYNKIKFPIRSIINLNLNPINLKYYSVNNYKNQHRKQQQDNHQKNSRDDEHHKYNYGNFYFKFGTTGIGLGLFGLLYINWDTFNYILFPKISAATAVANKPLENRTKFNFIADAVELTAPAVVYIEIKDTRRYDYMSGKPFTASNGSGFIVQSDGLILTNAHVVINKPHTVVQVRLLDGRTFPGTVEDIDSESDLATVRVKCKNLPTVKLGESSSLRAGEWVIALGSPLALSNTVTSGVISSTQRPSQELGLKGRNINYIQTDAPITFGNSGGPLVNLDGEAIGVNSMKVTAGISFAIPIDYAKEFLKKASDRRAKGGGKEVLTSATRRYMGITMLTLTDDIFRELQQRNHAVPDNVRYGVLVWKVIIGSPAHIGGLNPGDIITHINGKEVRNSSDIFNTLGEKGKTLNLIVFRGLKKMSITVQPEDF